MTDVLVKKKTLTNQSSLKIKENQKVNQRGDSTNNHRKNILLSIKILYFMSKLSTLFRDSL